MIRSVVLGTSLVVVMTAACSRPTGTLQSATEAMGAGQMNSIAFSGTGKWYQFGQAPNPTLPWPQFDVSELTTTVN